LLAIVFLALASCGRKAQSDYAPTYTSQSQGSATTPEYSFGVFPLNSAVGLSEAYQPLIDAINDKVDGFTLRLEVARDHPTYEAKLREGKFDFARTSQFQAVAAESMGYVIFGRVGGEDVRSIMVVRKDSGINKISDLRGKTISFSSPTADITMLCKVTLLKAGLNAETDAKPAYVGTIGSAVMNVYSGLTAAGCVWPPVMEELEKERPEVFNTLAIRWRSNAIKTGGFVARSDIPKAHVDAVAKAMFDLNRSEQGRSVLARLYFPQFVPANSKTYDPVRKFFQEYERLFGKLPEMEGTKK